jgi:hypothetical protein
MMYPNGKSNRVLSTWSMGLLCILMLAGVAMAAAPSGAIFTTGADGLTVNGNVYENNTDVYLDGGPGPKAPCSAAGLSPDGDYYFQVTNPSGSVLLSTDDVAERKVHVSSGVTTAYLGSTHVTSTGPCDSVTVQLMPYNPTDNPGGEYKVWMTAVGDYDPLDTGAKFGFKPSKSKTDNFKIRGESQTPPVAIFGEKFYDTNTNGLHDQDEPVIGGWRIEKQPPNNADVTFTGTNGQYSFVVDPDSGLYTISEVPPPPGWYPATGATWLNTTAKSGDVTVGNEDIHGPDFGNVCLGPGGGLTLGFWSNKNGQALFTGSDLTYLVGRNLRNATGANFDPGNYAAFRSWLLSATATNMAYMLSAQMSAMILNVRHGKVDGSALIYAPGTNSANGAGFASVNDILNEANTSLGANPLTVASGATRTYQEALKNALDKANNNLTFVQSGPCAFDSPYGNPQ